MNFGARRTVDDSETYRRVPRLQPPPASMYPTTSMSARGQRRIEEWNKLKNSEYGVPMGPKESWIAVPLMKQPTNNIPGAGVGARGKVELKKLIQPRRRNQDPNPIVATKEEQLEAIRASCGGFTKQPELHFNPTTMEVKSQSFNDKMRESQHDPRVAKQHALRTQPWSMYVNNNATGGSTKGYGKGGVKPCGGGSQMWGLVSGNPEDVERIPGMKYTGQDPNFRSTAQQAQAWRNGERGKSLVGAKGQQKWGSSAMSTLLNRQQNDQHFAYPSPRSEMNRGQCSPRNRFNGGINPITGRAYDSKVEEQRVQAQREALKRYHDRHQHSRALKCAAKDLLSPRIEQKPPNWLPANKAHYNKHKTSIVPDELRTSDLPNTSKTVYKQNNMQSAYVPWKPSRRVDVRPIDKAVAGLLGRGQNSFLPLTGPNDIWKPKQDASDNLTGYGGPSESRF